MEKPNSVLELFENHPERWTKGVWASNETNDICSPNDPEATCWCLDGALMHVYMHDIGLRDEAYEKLSLLVPSRSGIICFNDAITTTFEDVLQLVKEAGV